MTQDQPPVPGPPATPELMTRLWMSFLSQAIAFPAVLIVAVSYIEFTGFKPEWGNYSLAAGFLAILPSIPLLREFRELVVRAGRQSLEDPKRLALLHRKLAIGLAVADLPALAGAVHLFLTAQIAPTALFCLATVGLIYLYRPPTGARPGGRLAG